MRRSSPGRRARRPCAPAIYQGQYPTAQLYGVTIHRERAAGRRIALTYDDGPNPEQTPRLLELLARYDARATFFLIGKWAARETALIRQIVAAGHAIGNHTYSHPTMPAPGASESARGAPTLPRGRRDLRRAALHHRRRRMMRPPYGRRRPGTLRTMRAEGYVPVTWSITGYDWRAHTTAKRITRRCKRAEEGDIVLLHDGSDTEPAADRSRSIRERRGDPRALRPPGLSLRRRAGARLGRALILASA